MINSLHSREISRNNSLKIQTNPGATTANLIDRQEDSVIVHQEDCDCKDMIDDTKKKTKKLLCLC